MLSRITLYRCALLALVVMNSGFIVLSDDKRAGVPFVRELYTAIIMGATLWLFIAWKRVYETRGLLLILFMAMALPLLSALFAKLNFGQPITYGLLEERRFFLYLVFFPTLYLLYKAQVGEHDLARYVLYAGLLCAMVGFLYYFGIIPPNAEIEFQVDDFIGIDELRPDRFRIGETYTTVCAFMLMYSIRQRFSLPKIGLLLFFTAYLWLVIQTRQTMLVWAIAALWIFRTRIDSVLTMAFLGCTLFAVSYLLLPNFYTDQLERLSMLLNDAQMADNPRDETIETIVRAIRHNDFLGMGALSLQWNGGFASVYNRHFYLSDVGMFGVYYRYGLLTAFVLLFFYVGFFRLLNHCPAKGPLLQAMRLTFVTICLNFVLSNGLTFMGDVLGMAAAFSVYLARQHRLGYDTAQSDSLGTLGRVHYDRLQYRHY
ncbi:hypothetical protein [Stutzerimonas stutzeri]|uniref:hypothetical protein n=1 Tax=Stutzerimonas stutzeri TaxID=316 RepID=UPI003B80AB82